MDRVEDDETGQLNSVVDFCRSYSLLSFSEYKQIGFGSMKSPHLVKVYICRNMVDSIVFGGVLNGRLVFEEGEVLDLSLDSIKPLMENYSELLSKDKLIWI